MKWSLRSTEIKFYIETKSKYQKSKMHDIRSLILDPIWAPDKGAKVPILKECHFGKMQLCRVEHFYNLFVLTFWHDG